MKHVATQGIEEAVECARDTCAMCSCPAACFDRWCSTTLCLVNLRMLACLSPCTPAVKQPNSNLSEDNSMCSYTDRGVCCAVVHRHCSELVFCAMVPRNRCWPESENISAGEDRLQALKHSCGKFRGVWHVSGGDGMFLLVMGCDVQVPQHRSRPQTSLET